jgi:hypothetical protein
MLIFLLLRIYNFSQTHLFIIVKFCTQRHVLLEGAIIRLDAYRRYIKYSAHFGITKILHLKIQVKLLQYYCDIYLCFHGKWSFVKTTNRVVWSVNSEGRMYVQRSPKLLGPEISSFWSTKAIHGLLAIVPLQCYSVRGQSKISRYGPPASKRNCLTLAWY